MTALATQLKALRVQAGQEQEDVARAIGTNVGTVSRWERGRSLPQALQLSALSKHFGVSVDQLMHGADEGHRVELPEFSAFLQTEYGRIAQSRGYVRALLTMAYPIAPSIKLYAKLVAALMLEDEERKDPRNKK